MLVSITSSHLAIHMLFCIPPPVLYLIYLWEHQKYMILVRTLKKIISESLLLEKICAGVMQREAQWYLQNCLNELGALQWDKAAFVNSAKNKTSYFCNSF